MASIPPNLGRVSTQLQTQMMLSNLRQTNVDLINIQAQMATGYRVNRPSDDPAKVGGIMSLQKTLDRYEQLAQNMEQSSGVLDNTQQALSDVGDLLSQARTVALNMANSDVDAATRGMEADGVISPLISQLLGVVNRDYLDVFLFGGSLSAEAPFVDEMGGVRYVGSSYDMTVDMGSLSSLGINTNGSEALGALSARVQGTVDLDPQTTATTRLANVNGARNSGVTKGTIQIEVDTVQVDVDLSTANTLGDVYSRINNAIASVDPAAGSMALSTTGFVVTAAAGHSVTIRDIGTGVTAKDLGIEMTVDASASAIPLVTSGGDVDPKLNSTTKLSSLGASVDWTSGFWLSNDVGENNPTGAVFVDLSSATTIQDVINAVAATKKGVRMEINSTGTGLDVLNELSGGQMSIGEVAGGSTATDLGIRTMARETKLSDFRMGQGVRITEGKDDLQIVLRDGVTTVDVNLDGSMTLGDVLDKINAAGGGAVTASLAADGNGIELTDNTVDNGTDFSVQVLNGSFAASDLGIRINAGSSATLTGSDESTVQTDSVFSHLMMLRQGLEDNDIGLITRAGSLIEDDMDRVLTVRAQVGVRSQRVSDAVDRMDEQKTTATSLLSNMRDVDMTEAITRFTQLQQQLQANLLAGQQTLSMNLLDFLS